MAKRAKKTNGAEGTPKRTRPRSQDLPGLEERAIQDLEELAAEYADIRDRRMELNQEEIALKGRVMAAMKKRGKTSYQRDGIEIQIVPGEESVKVRVKKPEDDAEGADA